MDCFNKDYLCCFRSDSGQTCVSALSGCRSYLRHRYVDNRYSSFAPTPTVDSRYDDMEGYNDEKRYMQFTIEHAKIAEENGDMSIREV